jgi:hypothetical protein
MITHLDTELKYFCPECENQIGSDGFHEGVYMDYDGDDYVIEEQIRQEKDIIDGKRVRAESFGAEQCDCEHWWFVCPDCGYHTEEWDYENSCPKGCMEEGYDGNDHPTKLKEYARCDIHGEGFDPKYAESFGAEDDLTFQEWADQEMMTHGKPEPFDDWLDDELSQHGYNVSLHDWGNHELDSHYERYGAEGDPKVRRLQHENMTLAGSQMLTFFDVINIEYSNTNNDYDLPDTFQILVEETDVSATEDRIREEVESYISSNPASPRYGEDIKVVDFTAFYAGTTDPLRGNYEDYGAETVSPYYRGYRLKRETSPSIRSLESRTRRRIKQEAAYSQMMIASLIGLGAGLWGVSKWRDSQRSL